MKILTSRQFLLTDSEFKRVKRQYHSIGVDIQDSVIQYLGEEHQVRTDLWIYQYHEEIEDGGFKIILNDDDGCDAVDGI